jgi:transposase InsO family protein
MRGTLRKLGWNPRWHGNRQRSRLVGEDKLNLRRRRRTRTKRHVHLRLKRNILFRLWCPRERQSSKKMRFNLNKRHHFVSSFHLNESEGFE